MSVSRRAAVLRRELLPVVIALGLGPLALAQTPHVSTLFDAASRGDTSALARLIAHPIKR